MDQQESREVDCLGGEVLEKKREHSSQQWQITWKLSIVRTMYQKIDFIVVAG
jgi:hypothetical protein